MTDASMPSILARVRSEWRMKLWLGAALIVAVNVLYFTTSRFPLRTPVRLELSAIDRAVPFLPGWAWAYCSLYVMFPLAWLATTREQLFRYAAGLMLATAVGTATFVAFPVTGPRPADAPAQGLYGLLISIDSPRGAFPSLHMAYAAYMTCFAGAVLGRRAWPLVVILAAWTVVIGYSTLATKQHYFVDLPPGVALGCAGHWLAWRTRARAASFAAAPGAAA